MSSVPRVCGVLIVGAVTISNPVKAQLPLGTWVRQPIPSLPDMTMDAEACCNGGRRLVYHVVINKAPAVLTVDSPFDGTDAPVLMNGKPIGETMGIKLMDSHHATTVLKMNGKPFGTSKATLSPDGKTFTVVNDYTSAAGGQPAGKFTEIWVRK